MNCGLKESLHVRIILRLIWDYC